jgi:hypothetical protein
MILAASPDPGKEEPWILFSGESAARLWVQALEKLVSTAVVVYLVFGSSQASAPNPVG